MRHVRYGHMGLARYGHMRHVRYGHMGHVRYGHMGHVRYGHTGYVVSKRVTERVNIIHFLFLTQAKLVTYLY